MSTQPCSTDGCNGVAKTTTAKGTPINRETAKCGNCLRNRQKPNTNSEPAPRYERSEKEKAEFNLRCATIQKAFADMGVSESEKRDILGHMYRRMKEQKK